MDENNKQWEKLISMPEEYEQNSSLADKAIAEIKDRKPQAKKSWFKLHWKKVVACVASLALLVGIGIPVYQNLTTPPPVVYYGDNDLEPTDIFDVSAFVAEKGLGISYFNVPNIKTQSGTIKETGKVALLYQKLVYVSEMGFDQIELNVVLEKNLTLDFQEQYFKLNENVTVDNVIVHYKASITDDESQQIYAKFIYKNADYYLDVVTVSEPTECISAYVNMLIG